MSEQVRYHQVYHLKIEFEEGNNIMTFLGDELIYEERNAQGSAPPSQVFVKEEEESSGDETPGTSNRSEREDWPPVEMPRGQLLSPEEAERHRGLFERQRRDRELFIRNVVQRLKPRVIILGRRRYMLQLYQDDVPNNSPDNVEIEFTLERESSSSSSSSSSTSSLSSSSSSSEDDSSDSDDSDSSDSSDNDDPEERRGAKRRSLGSYSSEGRRCKRRKTKYSNLTRNSSDSSDED